MSKKIVFDSPDVLFEVDRDREIIFFTWNGEVSESSAKRVLSRAAGAGSLLKEVKWCIDRRNLEGYSAEARIWIKNDFIQDIGQVLIDRTQKIATLNSESPIAEVSAGVLLVALTSANSKIEHQNFKSSESAIDWLTGVPSKDIAPPKKRRLFGR